MIYTHAHDLPIGRINPPWYIRNSRYSLVRVTWFPSSHWHKMLWLFLHYLSIHTQTGQTCSLTHRHAHTNLPISELIREASAEAIRVTAAAAAMYPRSLWKSFSRAAVLLLNEFKQYNTDRARSFVRRAVWLTESNSIPRKEILCTRENLLYSQLTRSPNWLKWLSTRSLCSHNRSRDWAISRHRPFK